MDNIESSDSWNIEDELEPQNSSLESCSSLMIPGQGPCAGHAEGSTSNPARSKLIYHFIGMGFSENLVAKAIDENGEGNTEEILETLLTYSALEESPPQCEVVPSDLYSPEFEWDSLDDLSDAESSFRNEENSGHLSGKEKKMLHLVDMDFPVDEVSAAMDACGVYPAEHGFSL
ncbi:hypothetical protein BVC80_8957g18 [Macleaya cordata]|uniref:UBA-like n=1 Tax=Macleaya cordata TaxID=56857 RepID=A0A200QWI5_MACCD|nr:hypothetical protein BVC80_8957g18 [Macleaya cordata]